MTIYHPIERPPFAAHTTKSEKRLAGRTDASHTQLEIRSHGAEIEETLRDWVYERTGRQLGKFATQIERIMVRFGDENGPKGGVDRTCTIEVSLSSLPNVVVVEHGETYRESFDRAAGRTERATRRSLERHGFSAKPTTPRQKEHDDVDADEAMHGESSSSPAAEATSQERLNGRGEGQSIDTELPDTSESDRKVGAGHTASRNTKLNTAGMSYALEDSANGQASRKSTRKSANRIKPDNPLTRRTKAAVQSPQSQADRARIRGS